jgi:hypothetical protein
MSNTYTPTTEEVRGTYVVHGFRECHRSAVETERQSMDDFRAEFDRWLAAHDADTREQCAREIEKFRDTTKAGCVPRPESDLAGYYMRSGTIDGLDLAARLIREGGQK